MENLKPNQTERQELIAPPPLNTRTKKPPEGCHWSFIDQIQDGLYTSNKLIRLSPRINRDRHFLIKTRTTQVLSYRRNYSHKSVALYRTKKDGATRGNIAYMTGSFLELDGSVDGTVKSLEDVLALISKNNLPMPSYIIQTSPGNFHILWTYDNPLPWNERNESYWISVQKRYIELFKRDGFNVDKGASLNPCQNLRNPSQLNAYNYKRKCKVYIHKTYQKTSLRTLYRALNKTSIPNPKKVQASVKLRCDLRVNKSFITTHKAYAKKHGVSERTIRRELQKAIQNGDLQIVRKTGNNKRFTRATEYLSNLYIEPEFSERTLSISKNNSLKKTDLLSDFRANGAKEGRRNRTIFALGLHLKAQLGKRASIGAVRSELEGGAMRCHVSVREFERTLKNIFKPAYSNPLSLPKMREWDLLGKRKITEISLH